jgi:hypothetical protein
LLNGLSSLAEFNIPLQIPSKQGCNTRKPLGFADHLAACHVVMRETTAAFWPMGKFDVVALHLSGNFVFRENGIFV